ncbi:hypothetical protein [Luteitalea sp.]|uniref:hypothetical protein n=1 Tax=Luteitalea sp. TaxID=2004800 RepID=UPI0025BD6D99|nr:hypothetical protein [Luteitalea sp.]
MSDETKPTEPAIPVVAVVPVDAYADVLALAEAELGSLKRTGLRIALQMTEAKDAKVTAVLTVKDVAKGDLDIGGFLTRRYTGRWVGGLYLQWTQD